MSDPISVDQGMGPWPGLAPLARTWEKGHGSPSRLFYFDSDPGVLDRPVLLLVHGLGDEADSFRHLVPLLADRYRVLAVDLPGFGRSIKAGPTTLRSCVDAVVAVMDAAGLADALLAGSSLGSVIAESLAFSRPGRVSGLVLMDGGLPAARSREGSTAASTASLLRMALPLVGRRRYTAYRYDHGAAVASLRPYYADFDALPPADRDFLSARVVARVESEGQRRAYLSLLRSAIGVTAFGARAYAKGLAAWKKPLLVLWGSEDRIVPPSTGPAIAALAERGRFVAIEGAGHLPHQERPERVAELIADLRIP